jgi:hypothetical protein
VKCYIDNSMHLWSCIRNVNNELIVDLLAEVDSKDDSDSDSSPDYDGDDDGGAVDDIEEDL